MEARDVAGDHHAVKRSLQRLGRKKYGATVLPSGSTDENGNFVSFEGDVAKLCEGYHSYLERHFAADEFEEDRPVWSKLKTSWDDRKQIGPPPLLFHFKKLLIIDVNM